MAKPRPHTRSQIRDRREQVLTFLATGMRKKDIAKKLSVDPGTVTKDIQYLKLQSGEYIGGMLKETLPFLFEKSLVGINEVLKESWNIYHNRLNDDDLNWFHRIAALRLAKECSEEMYTLTKEGPFILGLKKIQIEFKRITETIEKERAMYQQLQNQSNIGSRTDTLVENQ